MSKSFFLFIFSFDSDFFPDMTKGVIFEKMKVLIIILMSIVDKNFFKEICLSVSSFQDLFKIQL